MNRHNNILLIFLLLTMNLSAQIVYDTIPDNEIVFGGHGWDELFIFKDFHTHTQSYFENVDFENIDCYGEKVFVETIFGKNGELKNTRIVKSASLICDSIAFNFVNGLKDWLPGLVRGKFVDIPFVFPISFDSTQYLNVDRYKFLNGTKEEFIKRNAYFEFFYSECSQKIINDFTYFQKYIVEKLGNDSLYVISYEYSRPKKKKWIKVEILNQKNDSLNYIIYYPEEPHMMYYILAKEKGCIYWDSSAWAIETNFAPAKKNGTIYLEKNKPSLLIGFIAGNEEPKLAIYKNIVFKNDTVLDLDLKLYEKNEMLNDIKYSP